MSLKSRMPYGPTTLTRKQLVEAVKAAARRPHGNVHKGRLYIAPEAFETEGLETNVLISRFSIIDCTGSVYIGPWCNITARCRIYTHDHVHAGRRPHLQVEAECGVVWQDKRIGADVCIYDGSIVLYQVTDIPDGVVVGAGSVLTKNPGPYEIWAGAPARKIGEREDIDDAGIRKVLDRDKYRLSEDLLARGEKWY